MKPIMTDRDIWPMLCKAIPVLADIPLVTGMTLDLAVESGKVPTVSITQYAKDAYNPEHLTGTMYRLQQNGHDASVNDLWDDFCRAFPSLKELAVTRFSLWVTAHQLVTMDIDCEVTMPVGGRILSQTYELMEVKE